jgi:SnoaL-like domain
MHDPRIDVAQTVYAFAYGIDQRDWENYREVFVPSPTEIVFDYESYHGRPASAMTVDTWLGAVTPLFTGLDATQHSMSNPIVEIDPSGSAAQCRVYMQAAHFLWRDDLEARTGSADPEFTIGGFYDDHLVLDDTGRWRADAVTLTVWWRRGNEAIMSLARE